MSNSRPKDSVIDIDFVAGIERDARFPKYLAAAGLTHRFAVVQQTYVEGADDMVIDEMLWRALVSFAAAYDPAAPLSVAPREKDVGRKEVLLSDYMAEWDEKLPDDRYPPDVVLLRHGQTLRLCLIAEAWYSCGGPYLYHDSCTHSLFSDRDIGDEVIVFLRGHADASNWRLADRVYSAEETFEAAKGGKMGVLWTEVRLWTLVALGVTVFAAWKLLFGG